MKLTRILKVALPVMVFTGVIILILHLRKLDFDLSGRNFYDLWPVIYIPLLIIMFVLLFIRLMRDEREISREHKEGRNQNV